MFKGNQILGIGILIFSFALLLNHAINFSDILTDIFMGIGIGLEIVGLVKQGKEKRSK